MSDVPTGSDSPQGEGWWQASDGRWYPPETHPDAAAAAPPAAGTTDDAGDDAGTPPAATGDDAGTPPAATGDDAGTPPATTGRETAYMPGPPQDGDTATAPAGSDAAPTAEDPTQPISTGTPPGAPPSTAPGTPPGSSPEAPPASEQVTAQQSATPSAPPAGAPATGQPPGGANSTPPSAPPPGVPAPGGQASGGQAPGGQVPNGQAPGTPPPGGQAPGTPPPGGQAPGGQAPGGAPPGGQAPGGQPPSAQPPAGPPPGGTPAGAAGGGEPPKKRGAGRILGIIGLVVVLTAGAVGAWAFLGGDEAAAAEVELESIGEPGEDPFTDPVAPEPTGSLQDFASGTNEAVEQVSDQVADYRSPDGSIPGIYGGSLNEAACDPDQLVAFLAQDADKAGVWAEVVGIDMQDIPDYVARLTPVNLGADTRVVDHGFRDGEAIERQVVLQRGSAVLVDPQGTPRVDCYSGSPLARPEPIENEDFVGEAWQSFGSDRIVVIVAAPSELQAFDLQDVSTGELFSRPVGSRGDADVGGEQEPEGDDSATRDLVEDGPIEFDTVYEDAVTDQRPEARYLLDAPDGAIMTFRISNARESQRRVRMHVVSDGDRYVSTRISPGADEEATIVVDHDGGATFELLFDEGPAEFTYEVELQSQVDAGQDGDAGDDFSSGREITQGVYEGLLGGQDGHDVYLLDAVPGAELILETAVDRASDRRARFQIHFNGERLYTNRVSPAADAQTSILLDGEDEGVLEIHVDEGPAIYGFDVSFVEPQDGGQAGDAGNELADARDLEVATELAGEVGGRDPADWYLFELPADRIEIPVAVSSDSDRRVRVHIQDADGSRVDSGRISPGAADVFEVEGEPGDEYRIVFDEGRARYTFQIGASDSAADDDADDGSEDE